MDCSPHMRAIIVEIHPHVRLPNRSNVCCLNTCFIGTENMFLHLHVAQEIIKYGRLVNFMFKQPYFRYWPLRGTQRGTQRGNNVAPNLCNGE